MSIIFYHNEEQRAIAVKSKERQEEEIGRAIVTEIIPFSEFHLAEDYHQKYYLTPESGLLNELRNIYPDIHDFVASTAVARINGYVGGYGTLETLKETLDSLGLSESGESRLLEIAERGLVSGCF
jgi:peptide-methionine (S)-S-oxide reductase